VKLTCDRLDALLPEFFDGTLDPVTEGAAADHLATCTACRIVVDDLGRVGELARDHGRLELPDEARRRIRRLIEERREGT
jgi:predicted anti-sigma-YlaC factor YlaD